MLFWDGCEAKQVATVNYNSKLVVHYINVGQGDCSLIQIENKNILIDAGPNDAANSVVNYLNSAGVKGLDLIIATHPHEDHIGGMAKVIRKFPVKIMYAPRKISYTEDFNDMVAALRSKKMKIHVAIVTGMEQVLLKGSDYELKILAPLHENYDEVNNYSVVCKLQYKNTSFLFTGDAESPVEDELLQKGSDIKADVLKVAHHGSRYSSTQEFINKVSPKIAVISCGKNNDYGHPAPDTLTRLREAGIKTYRTDVTGTVVILSDGQNVRRWQPEHVY